MGPWHLVGQIDLVGTRVGVIKARTVKRHPETLKWDRELYDAMNFVPWLIDGPVTRPEAGWEPTPGCKACDEEGSGVKRRCRLRELQASGGGGIIAQPMAVDLDSRMRRHSRISGANVN